MGALTTEQKKSLAKELYIQGTYTYAVTALVEFFLAAALLE